MQIILTHKNTDFDAFASTIAATILYPGSIVVLPNSVNPNVKAFLSIHKDIFKTFTFDKIDQDKVKTLIIVDTNEWERLQCTDKLQKKNDLEIILWDHHQNKGNINASWKCREEMGANITLMIRQLKKEKKILTPIQATLFLIGLYEDTGNLTFPSSTAEDAYAAAYLLENGADLNILGTFIRPAYSQMQKNILFEMVKTAKRTTINGYSISINAIDINKHINGLAVVVRMYRELLNVDAAFGIFLDRKRNKSILIGRSNSDSLNIGSIMKSLGGGGHPGAGSAMLKLVSPDAVEKMITDLIKGNQQGSVKLMDLMSFPVFSVSSDVSMKKVALALREKGYTGVPVLEGEKLVGIISRRDFRKLRKQSQLNAPAKAFMNTNVITIEPGKSFMQAARLMIKHDIGRIPVVDNGKIVGIITRSDAMLYFYDLLPD